MAQTRTETDAAPSAPAQDAKRLVVSVDAMGGDKGPFVVVEGTAKAAAENPDFQFLLHGDEAVLAPMMAQFPVLAGRCTLRHAARIVTMEDKPSQVMRSGQGTSMWSCIDSIRGGEASAAVSCGNTGALMAVAMIRLRRLPEVNRPAIACYWPSRNPAGFNVMLDVGADIRADAEDLLQYAMMGASYARNGLGLARPRVGLLNVGTEEHKGRAEMKAAHDLIFGASAAGAYDFVGFVEGGDIPSSRVDVIVTDGFTGNIALKTGEGTAKLIGDILKQEFMSSILSKVAALFAANSLRRMQRRIDPRLANGGVFLGLKGTVVKSHGSADATGVAAAIRLACQLARSGFQDRLAARVASALVTGHHDEDARNGTEA
jgi:phosphate acyltransferase